MCGIAGIVGSEKYENLAIVKQMTQTMALRGPDGEGIWHVAPFSIAVLIWGIHHENINHRR